MRKNTQNNEMAETQAKDENISDKEKPVDNTSKKVRGNKVTISYLDEKSLSITVAHGTEGTMTFSLDDYSPSIVQKLALHGLMKKFGSQGACAGKEGAVAEAAVASVHAALLADEWTIRHTSNKIKVDKTEVLANLATMPEEEAAATRAALASLGIQL